MIDSSDIVAFSLRQFLGDGFPVFVGRPLLHEPRPDFDLTCRSHRHVDSDELLIIRHGEGWHWVDGVRHPLTSSIVRLIRVGQTHHFEHRGPLEIINVLFAPGVLDYFPEAGQALPDGWKIRLDRDIVLDQSARVALVAMTVELDRLTHQTGREAEAAAVHALRELLLTLLSLSEVNRGVSSAIERLRIRIDAHPEGDWSIAAMCSKAGLSRSRLFESFRTATGHSPLDYVLSRRIRRARQLLADPSRSITEIAYACGFNDSNYFTRRFRQSEGLSPREARRGFEPLKTQGK